MQDPPEIYTCSIAGGGSLRLGQVFASWLMVLRGQIAACGGSSGFILCWL
ncbi:hypothetical protein [Pontibacter flavimaris]|nr:hypothetical protein [Pontibacter flavimaris]